VDAIYNGTMKNINHKFLSLDNSYDLYLTMTWVHDHNHGICGHVYEIIDYYLLLSKKFKVGILICEDMTWQMFESCIRSKYSLDESTICCIKNDITFCNRPKWVLGLDTNILFVDGGLLNSIAAFGVNLMVKNIFSFKCNPDDTHYNLPYKNITLLQDNRVYDDKDSETAIQYIKKIGFRYYKEYDSVKTDTALLYCTTNCKKLCNVSILDIVFEYGFKNYMLLTNDREQYASLSNSFKQISFPTMPVEDIFQKFDSYIYTPTGGGITTRKFDCSPRFIVECAHYGKNVIYHAIDHDYLEIDRGLKWRRYDIENNLKGLYLDDSDELIDILYDRL
jgi:hypothetical protein